MNQEERESELTEAEIDRVVISHAEDDSAWEEPIFVKRSRRWVVDPIRIERAAKFYVLSALNRLGVDASLSLSDHKEVDLTIASNPASVITINVKAVIGTPRWRVEPFQPQKNHFLVFVCYVNDLQDPHTAPDVYIVSSEALHAALPRSDAEIVSLEEIGSELGAREAWHRLTDKPAA